MPCNFQFFYNFSVFTINLLFQSTCRSHVDILGTSPTLSNLYCFRCNSQFINQFNNRVTQLSVIILLYIEYYRFIPHYCTRCRSNRNPCFICFWNFYGIIDISGKLYIHCTTSIRNRIRTVGDINHSLHKIDGTHDSTLLAIGNENQYLTAKYRSRCSHFNYSGSITRRFYHSTETILRQGFHYSLISNTRNGILDRISLIG